MQIYRLENHCWELADVEIVPPKQHTSNEPESAIIDWRVQPDDTFIFCGALIDIGKAKEIIRDKPRDIFEIPIGDFASLAETLGKEIETDFTIPIIVSGLMVIDEWARIRQAIRQGMKSLPGVLISESELELCILGYASEINN